MPRRPRPPVPSDAPIVAPPLSGASLTDGLTDRRPTAEGEPTMRPGPDKPTPAQARARREYAAKLVAAGASRELLREAFRERFTFRPPDDRGPGTTREQVGAAVAEFGGPMSDAQCDYLFDAVARERAERFDQDRAIARSAQAERLQRDLFRMRAGGRVPWHNVARHEELLGKVYGTLAPLRVEVDASLHVRETLLAVVGGMTIEEQDKIVAEQSYLEELAARLPPARGKGG